MRPKTVLVQIVIVLAAVMCASAAPSVDQPAVGFHVVVHHTDLHLGTVVYDLRPSALIATLERPRDPSRPELCSRRLTAEQADEWDHFLEGIPVDRLLPEVVEPTEDGALFMFKFSISTRGAAARTIRVEPSPRGDLAKVCRRIQALVPANYVPWSMYCGPDEQ